MALAELYRSPMFSEDINILRWEVVSVTADWATDKGTYGTTTGSPDDTAGIGKARLVRVFAQENWIPTVDLVRQIWEGPRLKA